MSDHSKPDPALNTLPAWARLLIVGVKQLGVATVILAVGGWWASTHVVEPLVGAYTEAIKSDMAARARQEVTLQKQEENLRTLAECQKAQIEIMRRCCEHVDDIWQAKRTPR
jgi:hypothetical protein